MGEVLATDQKASFGFPAEALTYWYHVGFEGDGSHYFALRSKVSVPSPVCFLYVFIAWYLLPVAQEKSFDLASADPRGSSTTINLWLETDVFQLRKHCAQ
jgi:hypothetical protein